MMVALRGGAKELAAHSITNDNGRWRQCRTEDRIENYQDFCHQFSGYSQPGGWNDFIRAPGGVTACAGG
jgi:hypothetical protein